MCAKIILDVNSINNIYFEDTRLLGITAPLKNYQFCWQLNNYTGFEFRLAPEKEIQLLKKNRYYYFNIYESGEENSRLIHYLYHNQHDGEYLLPEFRHMDFLWLMKGDQVSDEKFNWIREVIRSLDGVQLVTELTHEQIRNKGNMIF